MPGFAYGHQTPLTAMNDGTAIGRFLGSAEYMMLPHSVSTPTRSVRRSASERPHGWTRALLRGIPTDCDVAIGGMLVDVTSSDEEKTDGTFRFHLREPDCSWAYVDYEPGKDSFQVEQAGDQPRTDHREAITPLRDRRRPHRHRTYYET
jgi:hypothetical protein